MPIAPLSQALNRWSERLDWIRTRARMNETRAIPERPSGRVRYPQGRDNIVAVLAMKSVAGCAHKQAIRKHHILAKWWFWIEPLRSKFDAEENQD